MIALVGLLGILAGEQIPPLVKTLWAKEAIVLSWLNQICLHVFGQLSQAEEPTAEKADEIRRLS